MNPLDTSLPTPEQLRAHAAQLKKEATGISSLARVLVGGDPKRINVALTKISTPEDATTHRIVDQINQWLEHERNTRGTRLRAQLKEKCASANLQPQVVSQAPLELRLDPFHVQLDVEGNKAKIFYARELLETVTADADAIMGARDQWLSGLEGKSWDPAAFVESLYLAWRRAGGRGPQEMMDVLPELALLMQSSSFRRNPIQKNFVPYSRVQFAYDLWRLRRDKALSHDGQRLNLGAATGNSTRDKRKEIKTEWGNFADVFFAL